MSDDRIYCVINGCRRSMFKTTAVKRWGTPEVNMICVKHWRRLSKRERAVIARMRRKLKRFGSSAVSESRWRRVWRALYRRMEDPNRIGRELGL